MLTLACTDELDCPQAALCLASLSHLAVACAVGVICVLDYVDFLKHMIYFFFNV